MSPEQSRAARAWLDWSQDQLAAKAPVSLSTVRDFEKGRRVPIANNLTAMRVALETDGITFVDSAAHPESPFPSASGLDIRCIGGRGGTCALGDSLGMAAPHYAAPTFFFENGRAKIRRRFRRIIRGLSADDFGGY